MRSLPLWPNSRGIFLFFWYLGSNSRPCTCKAGSGITELNPQPCRSSKYSWHSLGHCNLRVNSLHPQASPPDTQWLLRPPLPSLSFLSRLAVLVVSLLVLPGSQPSLPCVRRILSKTAIFSSDTIFHGGRLTPRYFRDRNVIQT